MAQRRHGVLVGVVVVAALAIGLYGPISLAADYYAFADARTLWGIPNALDVVSNLPFLLVGLLGLRRCAVAPPELGLASWRTFFGGVALVAFGSMWFHLDPNDDSVVWDRVPITLAFTALWVALLVEMVDARSQKLLLLPALGLGVVSVVVWRVTGDLRMYVWVQVAPMLTLPVLLTVYESRYSRANDLIVAFGAYVVAKLCELWDVAIFDLTGGAVSGHTLKHLLAGFGLYWILRMLQRREPAGS